MDQLDKIETVVKNDLSWLQRHERLLLGVLVLAVVMFLGNKWLDKSAMDAKLNQAAVAQQLADAKQNSDKLAAMLAQQSAQFEQQSAERAREINALVVAMASRDAASSKKIEEVKEHKLPAQVVADLNEAYHGELVTPNAVTADGLVQFAPPVIQQFTVTKIERDNAVANLADQKDINAKQADTIKQSTDLIHTFETRVDGLNNLMVVQGKKCEADIAVVKADARKGKRFWYILGVVTGFLGRSAISK